MASRSAGRTRPKARAYTIEIDREQDGRWIAEIPQLPGVMAYGKSQSEAERKVKALALRVIADKIENKRVPNSASFQFNVA